MVVHGSGETTLGILGTGLVPLPKTRKSIGGDPKEMNRANSWDVDCPFYKGQNLDLYWSEFRSLRDELKTDKIQWGLDTVEVGIFPAVGESEQGDITTK